MNPSCDIRSNIPTATSIKMLPFQKVTSVGEISPYFDQSTSGGFRSPFTLDGAKITAKGNSDESGMFEIPKIPELFRAKLNVSSEIEELRSEDVYFNYVLSNILNLIDKSLNSIGHAYHVGVVLDIDQDLPNWKRANIIVGIKGMDHQGILNLWDNIGSEVGNYLESLGKNPIFPREKALSFYDFINVTFTPEGRICQ